MANLFVGQRHVLKRLVAKFLRSDADLHEKRRLALYLQLSQKFQFGGTPQEVNWTSQYLYVERCLAASLLEQCHVVSSYTVGYSQIQE
jgi:hypothetical protein